MAASFERLDGRVALVTGATMGIGRAIAQRLASLGADLVVTASGRDPAALDETRAFVQAAGRRAHVLIADLGGDETRAGLVDKAAAAFGPVTILVNNAAAIPAYAPPSKMDLPARLKTFEINFQAPLDLIQQALPQMRLLQWGRILNITSASTRPAQPPFVGPRKMTNAIVAYGAAKAALNRVTEGLAAELHGSGIHVNAVTPTSICASENAMQLARATASLHPERIEGVEMMAEAAALLIASSFTGVVANSRDVLAMTQSPLHALDGGSIIGDARSVPIIV